MYNLGTWRERISEKDSAHHAPDENGRIGTHHNACRIEDGHDGKQRRDRSAGSHGDDCASDEDKQGEGSSLKSQMGAQPDEAASDISDYQNLGKNTNYHEDKNQTCISVLGKPSDYCIPEIDLILTEDEASQDGDDGSKYQHFH